MVSTCIRQESQCLPYAGFISGKSLPTQKSMTFLKPNKLSKPSKNKLISAIRSLTRSLQSMQLRVPGNGTNTQTDRQTDIAT